MKKIIALVLSFSLFSGSCFADCDWSRIVKNPDGTYTYSKELNLCVGQNVQDGKTKDVQIQDLMKAVSLKDLAIQKADARAQNWMDTSFKLDEKVQSAVKDEKLSSWAYFGLGILTTFAAGYTAAKLAGH